MADEQLEYGDRVAFHCPPDEGGEAIVVGHPAYAPEHDVVILARETAFGLRPHVLNGQWCRLLSRGHVADAATQRAIIKQHLPAGFIEGG